MTSDRILSLNDVATEFAVEELEPRMEMQMLGLGADPGIVIFGDGFLIIISGTICTTYYCWYFV
jgi:hypothetical protein